tara:strand:- start:290 stop:3646 length:3357 start_codon:yes stop_codon:yes gene_type:complete
MRIDYIEESFTKLESDSTLQNLIAQANARYILYNTGENEDNFPRYTINDGQLNILAFKYLNIGCNYFDNKIFTKASYSIEKGSSILEHVHGSPNVQTKNKNLYGLISALGYYVSFQYSKSFILIKKLQSDTVISSLISHFLSRDFNQLLDEINQIIIDSEYTDEYLSANFNEKDNTIKIYEIIIAKALNNYVKYYYTGDYELLMSAKQNLNDLQEISEIKGEPDIWWVIRLLILILDGFNEASLWSVLGKYFDTETPLPLKYIQSLVYKASGNITELFITQRNSLPQVLTGEGKGSIVSIPTSSGKTRIGEISILNCIIKNPEAKILFIAPYRSLAYEIENSLDEIFSNLGISISHLYGGSLFSKLDEKIIDESIVIVATPEKSKALLRSNNEILSSIKLVIVDEGHLLGADKRLIINEMFYEELKFQVINNNGEFLLLSAVLPNARDLAEWLTSSSDNVYKENWRPSDERIGIMQWNGVSVDLNWQSTDTERNSFNANFILREELPHKPRQRKTHYFPESKNQAIAATAYKLKNFGPVLIFVGLKSSVFTIAKEYVKCITEEDGEFAFRNKSNWQAFELACTESYGANSDWLKFARLGVFCHNADLLSDVRLPLERLMRSEKPRAIIATSTLGQGVNLGVSTVIFSTIYQAGNPITKRDFWNIAGRAGRAFVDHEGKILVAQEIAGKDSGRVNWEKNLILEYFNKENIDEAESGCLRLIRVLKILASRNGLSFENLIELLAENRINEIHEESDEIDSLLDWIDDGLLALHNSNNNEGNDLTWVDDYFAKSLAYLQTKNFDDITGEEVVEFVKARIIGITKKVGTEKSEWENVVSSGIPINSDLQIEDKLDIAIEFIQKYITEDKTIESRILLLENIENTINDINALKADFLQSSHYNEIREMWLTGIPMSQITHLENAIDIITKHYSFNLPWVLNGISKKLLKRSLIEESDIIEELAILVELGLPSIKSVKIYQAGIRSRSSALEISNLFEDELWEKSIKTYKTDLIRHSEYYKGEVSELASSWINLLVKFSKRELQKITSVPNFTFGDVHKKTHRLIARLINGKQYLFSPDFNVIEKDGGSIDFTEVNKINGIYFDYDVNDKVWKMNCTNPYIKFD